MSLILVKTWLVRKGEGVPSNYAMVGLYLSPTTWWALLMGDHYSEIAYRVPNPSFNKGIIRANLARQVASDSFPAHASGFEKHFTVFEVSEDHANTLDYPIVDVSDVNDINMYFYTHPKEA